MSAFKIHLIPCRFSKDITKPYPNRDFVLSWDSFARNKSTFFPDKIGLVLTVWLNTGQAIGTFLPPPAIFIDTCTTFLGLSLKHILQWPSSQR